MRQQRTLGIIGVVAGWVMAMSGLFGGGTAVAVVFGVIVFLAGVRAIVKDRRSKVASL